MPLQLPASVRGFQDYFCLTNVAFDLIAAFGYGFSCSEFYLSPSSDAVKWAGDLRNRMDFVLRHFSLGSEMERREFIVAPILLELALHYPIEIWSEYNVSVNNQLRGTLDCLVCGRMPLVILQAKGADVPRGFSPLSAELIALDLWLEPEPAVLYGAVTLGDFWQFAALHRAEKRVVQDLRTYTVPEMLTPLLSLLLSLRAEAP